MLVSYEEAYLAVQEAAKALKANEPKPENIPEDFWGLLKKSLLKNDKTSN